MRYKTDSCGALGAEFEIVINSDEFIVIRDVGADCRSITNDAEAVIKMLLAYYADKRVFYFDSSGDLDELCHNGVRFTGFSFGAPDAVLEALGNE